MADQEEKKFCPMCGMEMEKIESDETEWWECANCGISPVDDGLEDPEDDI